jgi:hypothetical protein
VLAAALAGIESRCSKVNGGALFFWGALLVPTLVLLLLPLLLLLLLLRDAPEDALTIRPC